MAIKRAYVVQKLLTACGAAAVAESVGVTGEKINPE